MATGVLVVGVERATKILGLLATTTKSYAATIRLGQSTTTDDADGELVATVSANGLSDSDVHGAVAALRGEIRQVPSAFSAVKVGGRRAYQLRRQGESVELPSRTVRIDRFEVLAIRRVNDFVDLDVVVECSSGTYVRALARDVGDALTVGGHLTVLRRTRAGMFDLSQARPLDALAEQPQLSLSLDEACLMSFPRRDLTADEALAATHGRALAPAGIVGVYAATAPEGSVIALLRDDGAHAKSVVVLRPATL
jgi:tRNA pseudouridine55 synthase